VLAEAVEAARALDPDVHVIPEFVPGDLYATVRARTEGADLLVLGAGHPHLHATPAALATTP
jgi:nucleotide-binding universal stress UspA family protein